MIKYLLPLLLLSTLISCKKEGSIEFVSPNDFPVTESLSKTNAVSFSPFLELPLLNLHPKSSSIDILNSDDELVENIPIQVSKRSLIRSKLLELIDNPNSEELTVDDLFKFKFDVPQSEIFKFIDKYSFANLKSMKGRLSIKNYLYSEGEGLLDDLAYSSGIENDLDIYTNMNLENNLDQTSGFQFGEKPSEAYDFNLESLDLIYIFKNLASDKGIVFSLDDFKISDKEVLDWKREVLEKGSLLIISNKDSQKYMFIPHLKSVEDILIQNQYDLLSLKGYRKINFNKFNEKITYGSILSIVELDRERKEIAKNFLEYQKVKSIKFEKIKDKTVHLFIQLEGIKHSISHRYEAQRVSLYENNIRRRTRTCNVSRRSISKSPIRIDPLKDKLSYIFKYNGLKKSIDSLIKEGFVRVERNKNSQHIIIDNLPGLSDKSEVTFELEYKLKLTDVIQDKGQCVLYYRSRTYNVEGANETKVKEERFDSFRRSVSKKPVGIEKIMNVISVL